MPVFTFSYRTNHLRDLRCIHKFLTVDTAVLMANAMVSSQLDYCNSLLRLAKANFRKFKMRSAILFSDWTK